MYTTQDSGWFDPAIGKYVVYVRRDLPIPGRNCSAKYGSAANTCRLIGRCETSDLLHWEQGNPGGCPAVFGPDAEDPEGVDLYTSGFAPYEGVQLFFPAVMYSFGHRFPFGYGNDGLLDVRFAASRDGRTISYVPGAANAREPWVELGTANFEHHFWDHFRGFFSYLTHAVWCEGSCSWGADLGNLMLCASRLCRSQPMRPACLGAGQLPRWLVRSQRRRADGADGSAHHHQLHGRWADGVPERRRGLHVRGIPRGPGARRDLC